jgi:hypothetical protein
MQEELLAAARREAAAAQAAKAAPRLQQRLQVSPAYLGLRDMMARHSRRLRRTGLSCVCLKVYLKHDQKIRKLPLTETSDLLNPWSALAGAAAEAGAVSGGPGRARRADCIP